MWCQGNHKPLSSLVCSLFQRAALKPMSLTLFHEFGIKICERKRWPGFAVRLQTANTSTCCFLWATRDSMNKINRLMLLLQRRMMRAQRLNIGTGLWHYVRKWWATEYFSCSSTDPRHNYEQMAEDLSYSFSVVLPLFRLLFPDFFISLFENFSERGKLLHADILFCFC